MSTRVRVGSWLLAATVAGSALALGGLHTPVLAVVAAFAAVQAVLLWSTGEAFVPRPAATLLVAVSAALVAWTCVQIVPLPRALVAAVAPENADVWARALSPLHEDGPPIVTLSLDPLASRVQILRGLTYLAVFLGALRIARRREGTVFLERVLIGASVVVAAGALVHPALGARKIWGLYEPKETLGYMVDRLGPLLNLNHLAAYTNIGLLLAFGALVDRRPVIPRPIALVVVLLLGATTVWSYSRGGTATMIVGVLVVALMVFAPRRGTQNAGRLAVILLGLGGTAVGLLSAFDGTLQKFQHNDLSKLELARNVVELVRRHPVFGVGRGAFESTFPSVRVGTDYYVFTHPENLVLQWTSEWGVPVALLGLAAIAWALRPRTALARSRPPAGAWGALVAVGLQNLVDFSSEVPGVVLALAVCAAIVTGGAGETRGAARWASRPRLVAGMLAGAIALAAIATVPFADIELYNEERAFRELGVDRSVDRATFHERARAAMLRHPAEPYFPFVGAVRAVATREESILPWAGRVLERSPVHGRVHLLLARTLFVRNPSQARLEYRTACVQDAAFCGVEEEARLVFGPRDAMELVPDGPRGITVLERVTALVADRLPATVVILDRELARRDPQHEGPVRRAAAAAVHDVGFEEPWCTTELRKACVADGLAAARRLTQLTPERCEPHALTAELRMLGGETDAALSELEDALDRVQDRSACARRFVGLAASTKENVRIDRAVDRLLKLGCESPEECVVNLAYAASIERSRGSARRALALTRRAWEREPSRDDLLVQVADESSRQGFHGEALDAYRKLAERHPEEPRWKEAVAREREAAARGAFGP